MNDALLPIFGVFLVYILYGLMLIFVVKVFYLFGHLDSVFPTRGQSYKAHFGINYIKNRLNLLKFTLNYINFDVIYAKKVL